jgi:RNA recognition motif-containing protein
MTRLYVGNLSSEVKNDALQQLFTDKGFDVASARVICDRDGGRSRGFGFVELKSRDDAERAIGVLNGVDVGGRAMQVSEAHPRESRDGHGYAERSKR